VAGALPHNPLVTHETDPRHLRDPGFLGAALRHRAARLLFTLQTRIRGLRGKLGELGRPGRAGLAAGALTSL
jgi:acyl-CoA oxidase